MLITVASAVVARLGRLAKLFITERLVEEIVRKWLDFGFAQTAEAVNGKSLSVAIGSAVMAASVNRAIKRADANAVSRWVLNGAGGAQELANKFVRMLPLDEGVSSQSVVAQGLGKADVPSRMTEAV